MTDNHDATGDDGSRLLSAVRAIAISPADAQHISDKYTAQARQKNGHASESEIQRLVADKIISRYSRLAAASGSATALTGVVPGIGTLVAALGGALADCAVSMKFQVDMSMCMAATFKYDLNSEDAQHLAYLVALGGTLEKAGTNVGTKLASEAGVRMLRQYLKGATLQAIKELFKKIGIIFTRKALEKMLPFGIGVVIGGTANYALTTFVGKQAKSWFILDQSIPK